MRPYLSLASARTRPGSILINEANINTGAFFRCINAARNSSFWHCIIVHNAVHLERNFVLKVILDHVFPLDLIPVLYTKSENVALFLARNCGEALEKINKDKLVIPNPLNSLKPFKIEMVLKHSSLTEVKIDVQKNVSAVCSINFQHATRAMNLDAFHENKELSEFSPLSQPKLMYYVLHLASSFQPRSISLRNNELKTLLSLEALWDSNITSLDLRNNLISNISQLEPLKQLKLTELWLDGNPLCSKYESYTYIGRIKDIVPSLKMLDGVIIQLDNGFPTTKKNFLCDIEGKDLVDQFLEHFFTIYDSPDRKGLIGLYHKDAMFSLTMFYKNGQVSSSTAQLRSYQAVSRNLQLMADLSKSDLHLFHGNLNIVSEMNKLPLTDHDPYSFTADLLYNTPSTAVIAVTGVFKEPSNNLLQHDRYLGFNRMFVLQGLDNEYCITNDLLQVHNALTVQQNSTFVFAKPAPINHIPLPKNLAEEKKLIEALALITGLTHEASQRYLAQFHFDLRKALSYFVDMYKVDRIPLEEFQNLEAAGYDKTDNTTMTNENVQNGQGKQFDGVGGLSDPSDAPKKPRKKYKVFRLNNEFGKRVARVKLPWSCTETPTLENYKELVQKYNHLLH